MIIQRVVVGKFKNRYVYGLVDFFAETDSKQTYINSGSRHIFDDALLTVLEKENIYLSKKYISHYDLLSHKNNMADIYYEFVVDDFVKISRLQQQYILDNFNVIISDLHEGGCFIKQYNLKIHREPKNLIILTSGFEEHFSEYTSVKNITLPIFMHLLLGSAQLYQDIVEIESLNKEYTKDLLIPMRKPREHRLNLLLELEKRHLLDNAVWSLVVDSQNIKSLGDFYRSPGVAMDELKNDEHIRFAERHNLPKILPEKRDVSPARMSICKSLFGKCRWHIAVETYPDACFPTEKTFKSMITGSGSAIVAAPGLQQHLKQYGFQFQGDYDHLAVQEKIEYICDDLIHQEPDLDIIINNHKLITDFDFLCDIVVKELSKIT